jgi:ribosomal-protein-alanine N-acetyltransferase
MSSAPPRAEIPKLTDLPLVIETPRLRMRPVELGDADAFFPLASEPEVSPLMLWRAHASITETREWLTASTEARAKGSEIAWAIEHAGAIIGCIGLTAITWATLAVRCDRASLGYWLAKDRWGDGLMTEAATEVTRWGFETLGLHKITVTCFEPNVGSRRVIEKVGYRFVGRSEEDVWRDDQWFAHLRYELTAAEWADSTRTLRFDRPS